MIHQTTTESVQATTLQRIVQQQQGQLHQKQDRQVSLDFVDYLCIIRHQRAPVKCPCASFQIASVTILAPLNLDRALLFLVSTPVTTATWGVLEPV